MGVIWGEGVSGIGCGVISPCPFLNLLRDSSLFLTTERLISSWSVSGFYFDVMEITPEIIGRYRFSAENREVRVLLVFELHWLHF